MLFPQIVILEKHTKLMLLPACLKIGGFLLINPSGREQFCCFSSYNEGNSNVVNLMIQPYIPRLLFQIESCLDL